MSYPKASAGDSPGGVPASPRFPQIEETVRGDRKPDPTVPPAGEKPAAGENRANP